MESINRWTTGTSLWQWGHQWAKNSNALEFPFFSNWKISEFWSGAENVGAASPSATLSSFSPAYWGRESPTTLISPSGSPAATGSELKVTPIAIARPEQEQQLQR